MNMWSDLQDALVAIEPGVEPGTWEAKFCFAPGLSLFKGHFPDHPILPGVMQVEMAHLAMARITGANYRIIGVKKAKFTGEVFPGDQITVRLAANDREDCLQVRAQLSVGDKKVGSVILDLQAS
jgi:3-hydroxyacyl-[acyl-carrier-protein] dehydratase